MWPNPQFPADLVTFTEEILNGKLHFLRSDCNARIVRIVGDYPNRELILYLRTIAHNLAS